MSIKIRLAFSIFIALILQDIYSLEPVRNYLEQTSFINRLSNKFTSEIIGSVKYSNNDFPIYKISYNRKNDMLQKKYLVVCGVHGNEPAPVFAVKEYLLELDANTIENLNITVDFIYIVNPWGFSYNQRNNGDNNEINRDLETLKTQEARIIKKNVLPSNYEKVFDFHEASSSGFFLYCYGNKNKKFSIGIINKLKEENVKLETGYKDVILHAKNGVLFVPFYASLYMSIRKRITVGQYFIKCKNVFTFETSKYDKIDERKRIIRILLKHIIEE